jgi:uncharacterized protein YpbB
MAIIASATGGNEFERAPAGQYSAVCYRVIDLGTQAQKDKVGKISHKRKIIIGWELDERMSDGRRFSQQERYTLSLHEMSALRPMLESWRGRPFTQEEANAFDVAKLIGAPALIQLVHNTQPNGKLYVNMSSIMKLPKGMEALQPENETLEFSLDDFNQTVFDKLSDKLKETIMQSPEYQEIHKPYMQEGNAPSITETSEEIPF